jgi:hypothetical protein
MLLQNGLNSFIVVLNISSLLFGFVAAHDSDLPEEVVSSKGHEFPGEVKSDSLKESLPRQFVHPVELQHKGEEDKHRHGILNFPLLPLGECQIKLKWQELDVLGIVVDPIAVGLQFLLYLPSEQLGIGFAHFVKIEVPVFEVEGECAGPKYLR